MPAESFGLAAWQTGSGWVLAPSWGMRGIQARIWGGDETAGWWCIAAQCRMHKPNPPSHSQPMPRLMRLWQPSNPLFWLVIVFNLMSSGMAWALHLLPLQGWWLGLLTLVALLNTVVGSWLLWRLWHETAPASPPPSD